MVAHVRQEEVLLCQRRGAPLADAVQLHVPRVDFAQPRKLLPRPEITPFMANASLTAGLYRRAAMSAFAVSSVHNPRR